MANFQDILSKKAAEIEKPVPAPIGHYIAVNQKVPEFREIGEKETPAAEFTLTLLQPGDDVDPDEFEAYGGVEKLKGKSVRYTMWLSEDAQYKAAQTLTEAFGIEQGKLSLGEMIAQTPGVQLMVEIAHRPSKDGSELYMEARSISAA